MVAHPPHYPLTILFKFIPNLEQSHQPVTTCFSPTGPGVPQEDDRALLHLRAHLVRAAFYYNRRHYIWRIRIGPVDYCSSPRSDSKRSLGASADAAGRVKFNEWLRYKLKVGQIDCRCSELFQKISERLNVKHTVADCEARHLRPFAGHRDVRGPAGVGDGLRLQVRRRGPEVEAVARYDPGIRDHEG